MLGKYLGELQGKLTTQRVIKSISAEVPTLEVTVLREGNLNDIDVVDMGTFIITSNRDDSSHAYGNGFIKSKDNSSVITYFGKGIGKYIDSSQMAYRGAMFFNNSSSSKVKLSSLDNLVVLFEDSVGETTTKLKLWEWK